MGDAMYAILDESRGHIIAVKELPIAANREQQQAKYGPRMVKLIGAGAAGDAVELESDGTAARVKAGKRTKAE